MTGTLHKPHEKYPHLQYSLASQGLNPIVAFLSTVSSVSHSSLLYHFKKFLHFWDQYYDNTFYWPTLAHKYAAAHKLLLSHCVGLNLRS